MERATVKILTTVKRIMDPDAKVRLSPDKKRLLTDGVEPKFNSFDEYGVEEALRLVEKHGGEVVVVSVGSQDAIKELRTALAMGAHRGVLVEADADAIDAGVVAQAIAAVAKKENPDLIITGKLSVDSENNQVSQQVAGILGWPQGTFAYSCTVDGGWATVGREVDGGTATVRLKLPAVVTADLRLNQPRYASLPGIMKAKSKPVATFKLSDLGVSADAKTKVVGYELPPARAAGEKVADVDTLVDRLRNKAKVL
jgi:electron transfer flavoprotein beta subunit